VLASVVHCAQDCANPTSQKVAFSVLGKMTIAWGGGLEPPNSRRPPGGKIVVAPVQTPKPILSGFDGWVLTTLAPLLFNTPRGADKKDGGAALVLGEIGECHRILYCGWGERYVVFLKGYIGDEGCARFTESLGEAKGFVKVLRAFYL
jgi:hypothetical protein